MVPLIAVVMGISVVLVPVIGWTARHVLKPFERILAQAVQARGSDEVVRALERRMALMEQQLDTLETTLGRVAEAAEFDRQLRAPGAGGTAPATRAAPPPAPGSPPHDARP